MMTGYRPTASAIPANTTRPGAGSTNVLRVAFTATDPAWTVLKRFCTPTTSEIQGSPNPD